MRAPAIELCVLVALAAVAVFVVPADSPWAVFWYLVLATAAGVLIVRGPGQPWGR